MTTRKPSARKEHTLSKHARRQKWLAAFAANVTRYRQKMGWRQCQLAAELGVSPGQINNIERGRGFCSVDVFLVLCVAFGIGVPELFRKADKSRLTESQADAR